MSLSFPRGLAALLLILPTAAQACPPQDPDRVRDDPLVVYSDGSFTGASNDDFWAPMTGRPVRDIGGGRVGQIIQVDQCGIAEYLLVVDCTTGSAVLIAGLLGASPDDDPNIRLSARALQAPYGPLALTPATTVAEIAALARAEGWTLLDPLETAAENGRHNAYDPFMGCEIFYPDSLGATR